MSTHYYFIITIWCVHVLYVFVWCQIDSDRSISDVFQDNCAALEANGFQPVTTHSLKDSKVVFVLGTHHYCFVSQNMIIDSLCITYKRRSRLGKGHSVQAYRREIQSHSLFRRRSATSRSGQRLRERKRIRRNDEGGQTRASGK